MNVRPRLAIAAAAWGAAVGGACFGCSETVSSDNAADASDGTSEVASERATPDEPAVGDGPPVDSTVPNLTLAEADAQGGCVCPVGSYFVEIDADGAPLTLPHRGGSLPDWCDGVGPDTPMARGSQACDPTVSLTLSACEGPDGGLPCFEATGSPTYTDRGGHVWSVDLVRLQPEDAATSLGGMIRGAYTAELRDGTGATLVLTGHMVVCGTVIVSLILC